MRRVARPPSRSAPVVHGAIAVLTSVLVAAVFVACGGSGGSRSAPTRGTPSSAPAGTPTTLPDVAPTAARFVNIHRMTRVGDHFVGSLNGHLAAALAVARSPRGGRYPVGTVIQLIPTEAMVKRHAGYSPSTNDWEFFALAVSANGTRIVRSGAHGVVNVFGADCASCHSAAEPQFDFVCGKDHGCAPLGLTDALIRRIQQGDPRPLRRTTG